MFHLRCPLVSDFVSGFSLNLRAGRVPLCQRPAESVPASVRLCFWFFVEFEGWSCSTHSMPRRPRIEFEGAIYHVMARGNARQRIVRDDHDRERLLDDLRRTVLRCGWELLAFVFMENHLHLLLKTPRPNLARGMQQFLSSYAIWHGRRHRRVGHLFQGRYRAELIEDESYYWTVSRYIHPNPVRAGLVDARTHGGGRAIPAMPSRPTACPGWPTRPCCRPGVASTVEPIQRVPTGALWRQV